MEGAARRAQTKQVVAADRWQRIGRSARTEPPAQGTQRPIRTRWETEEGADPRQRRREKPPLPAPPRRRWFAVASFFRRIHSTTLFGSHGPRGNATFTRRDGAAMGTAARMPQE